MGKRNKDRDQAALIERLRREGKTDAQIIAQHGEDGISAGYRWLEANPGVSPSGEQTSSAPRGRTGGGAPFEHVAAL